MQDLLMNARSIALVSTFAATAIALNAVNIPTIFYPNFSYPIHEIPVVAAFLLFGLEISVLVEVLNIAGQLTLFPVGPAGFAVYPMGLVVAFTMFTGMYLASRIIARKTASEGSSDEKKTAIYLTAFAVAFRAGIMPFVDYGIMYHVTLPFFLGTNIPETYIAALVPGFILYNVIVPLYTVPVAYTITTSVSKALRIKPRFIRQV